MGKTAKVLGIVLFFGFVVAYWVWREMTIERTKGF
jgi:hypothetical protein